MSESNLAERFARTQGWTWHEAPWGSVLDRIIGEPHWCSPEGQCLAKSAETIDERILPIIWADCKAKGWQMSIYGPLRAKYEGAVYVKDGDQAWTEHADDPITALCEAYCKAKDATE